jgi:GNAT superfamily N-acetyltransferase
MCVGAQGRSRGYARPVGELTISRAASGDSSQLTMLCRSSAAYRGIYADAIATVEVAPAYIAENLVFVATGRGGELLGFYSLIREPPELDMMFVADDAQRSGTGRALVGHMIEQARQIGLRAVRVVSHPPAEGFYLRMGARRTGTVAAQPPTTTWDRPELHFGIP